MAAWDPLRSEFVCLPQDPHNLFVYWIFTPQRLALLRSFIGKILAQLHLALRFSSPEDAQVQKVFTFPLSDRGQCYFSGLASHLSYYVE
ncbi:MAG TPA: hypothetical protein ENM97_07530, partial [Moorella mulderi]|nr:hypothetical protein [Moorella mulderi]